MKSKFYLLILPIAVLFSACGPEENPDQNPQVVATTTMVVDMVQVIGAEEVDVSGLMAPGVDPHTYNLPARSIATLKKADAVIYSGHHLEGRSEERYTPLKESGATVLAVAETVEEKFLLFEEGFEGHPDPHVWGDPVIWSQCVPAVVQALSKVSPENAETFQKRGDAYQKELRQLDEWAKQRLASVPADQRVLVTSHDAFSYFGKAYGLEVIGIQGLSTESEAGAGDIDQAVQLIRDRGVKAIFVETSVNPATIEKISSLTGAKIGGKLFSDSLGEAGKMESGGGEEYDVGTYIGMLKHNVNTIVDALGKAE